MSSSSSQCLTKEETLCPQESDLQINPEISCVTIKNEQIDSYEDTKPIDNSNQFSGQQSIIDNLEETKQIFISVENVKQEPNLKHCTQKIEDQKDPLALNDMKTEDIKKEYLCVDEVKQETTIENQEEEKQDAMQKPVNHNTSSFSSISEDNIPSSSSHGRENSLFLGEEEPLLESEQNTRKRKNDTGTSLNDGYKCEKVSKNYECSSCNKNYSCKKNLDVHIDSVHKKIKYECSECHKLFSQEANLKTHINIVHKKSEMHECCECHKLFSQVRSLKQHMHDFHKKLIGFECTECGKIFTHAQELKTHINFTHEGHKLECDECGKPFQCFTKLKIHINTVHKKIKKFECTICDKFFSQQVHSESI